MLTFRISETSGRIPVALFILELVVFHTAVMLAAHLGFFSRSEFADTPLLLWLLRGSVFSGAMIVCMAVLKLYQGRPGERIGTALLRLAASFVLAAGVLQAIYLLVPGLQIEPAVLGVSMVLAFFFLGTTRPVFLDSVTERRERLRSDSRARQPLGEGEEDGDMSREEFLARLARNQETTSLTAQHRITRRGV